MVKDLMNYLLNIGVLRLVIDLKEGTELILDSIAHFPTLYKLTDSDGKIWTLPVHSVEKI